MSQPEMGAEMVKLWQGMQTLSQVEVLQEPETSFGFIYISDKRLLVHAAIKMWRFLKWMDTTRLSAEQLDRAFLLTQHNELSQL